jgi:5-methylcytosine-specific restriction endonuclease McrA
MVKYRSKIWNKKVLVLNKHWNALGITRMPRALSLILSEYRDGTPKAQIIHKDNFQLMSWNEWKELEIEENEETLTGASGIYKAPQAIKLARCERFAKIETAFNKKNLFFRDSNRCQYCGIKPGIAELSIDHIIPKSLGGKNGWLNCTTACKTCNFNKGNLTLEKSGMTLLSVPARPTFDPVMRDCEDKSSWPELWLKLIN